MVKITKNYWFDRNEKVKCFTLYFREVREKTDFKTKQGTGQMIEADSCIGYYSNIDSVALAVADHMVMRKCNDGTITHISEYLAEYRKAATELKAAINKQDAPETHED